ncbi:MAG: hypothetical protein NTZ50_05915 [Chloroflexi bacterium]|nr:hypothetical protein [Chloroflexota bacterium]
MRINRMRRLACVLALVLFGAGFASPAPASAEPASPDAPLDAPDVLVAEGVHDYTVGSSKVFWHSRICENAPPTRPAEKPAQIDAPLATDAETISRIPVQGGEARTLYSAAASGYCGSLSHPATSNLIADAHNIFWNTAQGLYCLPVDANLGDAPLLITELTASSTSELVDDGNYLYVLTYDGTSSTIMHVAKSGTELTTVYAPSSSGQFSDLQLSRSNRLSGSGNYLYWLFQGDLYRLDLDAALVRGVNPKIIASSVTAYHAEGGRVIRVGMTLFTSDLVYFSTGGGRYVKSIENSTLAAPTSIYDTGSSDDAIYDIATTASYTFFLRKHRVPCAGGGFCFDTYTSAVLRHSRGNSSAAATLATGSRDDFTPIYSHLTTSGSFLLWKDEATIQRLPQDSAALAQTNMKVTGMSITQGIQKGSGSGVEKSVTLIQGRRTFVRVFVKSDGPNVSGVTARLYRTDAGGTLLDSVLPVNSVGTNLTVRASPSRSNLNDSFLFELPWSWLPANSGTPLYLSASLNPYHAPIESSYSDNSLTSGALTFQSSAALKVNFVMWGYKVGNKIYYPRLIKDVIQTYSWLIRAYPLASKITFDGGTGSQPGLHPTLWLQYDDALGPKVMQTDGSCVDNLCASAYTNGQMGIMRSDDGIASSRFFYGFISDAAGAFPRGQACCATNVSSGPAGVAPGMLGGWDADGSYADWYAAHEIGHTLGRAHPTASASTCKNSASDGSYPYTGGQIGANNNAEGFDAGDPAYGVARAIYPGTTWYDVMSYCSNQWISDYTYEGMRTWMASHPSRPDGTVEPEVVKISGDFLHVSGRILSNSAVIESLTRSSVANSISPDEAGAYAIGLYDANGAQLSYSTFAPIPPDNNTDTPTFGRIIHFAAGTRMVKIIRVSDGAVLASRAVSAHVPTVSSVALQGAPNPVTGTVTLNWSASDADGDALTFDVRYSNDGGNTWVGVQSGLTSRSASIDASTLGGGTGRFRVIASDGANTGSSDGAIFEMAAKPPLPLILTPNTGLHIHYGQLVNFSGAAFDWQQGGVTGADLVWTSSIAGALGTGEQISAQDLAIGTHVITLAATNANGLSASASITVVVDDDTDLLGPTLTAGPLSFNWSVSTGATTPVTDVLHIGNAGDGALDWTASTDVPWLQLSVITGTDEADVTLTADPSSVANGAALSGTLTLSMPAAGDVTTQTIEIYVSLAKGFDALHPLGYIEPKRVRVPFVRGK